MLFKPRGALHNRPVPIGAPPRGSGAPYPSPATRSDPMRKPIATASAAVSAQAAAGRNPPTGKAKAGKKTPAKKIAGRNPPTGKPKN